MSKSLGQIAHEAGERAGAWSLKWDDVPETQRGVWESLAAAVAAATRASAARPRRGVVARAGADRAGCGGADARDAQVDRGGQVVSGAHAATPAARSRTSAAAPLGPPTL